MQRLRKQKGWVAIGFLGGVLSGHAQPPPPAPVVSPTVRIVAVPDGADVQAPGGGFSSLDLGHVSWARDSQPWGVSRRKDPSSFGLVTRIGLQVDCGTAGAGRTVSVRASLDRQDPHHGILLDGAAMGPSPMGMSAMPCGSTAEHTLEITIPVTAPAGPLSVTLVFEVNLQ